LPTSPVSIVSGGSRGLGLALVESLLARGDHVATFSRSGSPALSALAAAHADRLHAARADAADADAIRGFVADVAGRFGRIDHCIANAAIAQEGVLATMRDDEIEAMLAVNVRGSIVLVRECVRQMLVVNCVAPGFVETEIIKDMPGEVTRRFVEQIPVGRLGRVDDVVNAVLFLCGAETGYVTGQVIHVNGGFYM